MWDLLQALSAAMWVGLLHWAVEVPVVTWTRLVLRAQRARREVLKVATSSARRVREEEETDENNEEPEEETGDIARRQRDKPRGKASMKKAATIAGRRRSTAAVKSQSKVFDPGGQR